MVASDEVDITLYSRNEDDKRVSSFVVLDAIDRVPCQLTVTIDNPAAWI